MNEKEKVILLKALLFGYAEITVEHSKEEHRKNFWYSQCQDVVKWFKKQKPEKVSNTDRKFLDRKFKELVKFDTEYFGDKEFSSYINMITILEYLILNLNDTSLRVNFGHYEFGRYRTELEQHLSLKDLYFDSNRFLVKILDNIGE